MSDTVLIGLIGLFQAVIICAIGAFLAIRTARMQLDSVESKKVIEKVHTLVNSNYGVALMAVAALARWKADTTKKPADKKAAEAAELKVTQHEQAQAKVDAIQDKVDV